MEIVESFEISLPNGRKSAIAIGNFDGVHLGHQEILRELTQDKEFVSIVITFSNHPSTILAKEPTPLIYSVEKRIELICEFSPDYLCLLPFTREFASQTSHQFIELLHRTLNLSKIISGEDARFGKDQASIQASCSALGIITKHLPLINIEGVTPSSSQIRDCLSNHDIHLASKLLGRPYEHASSPTSARNDRKSP